MFAIGDVIIYSEHGLCRIDDVSEKTFAGETRMYYELHPLEEETLKISTPVDNEKVVMLKTMDRKEAEELLQLFKQESDLWIEDTRQRNREYQNIIQSGEREEVAKVANTLMRKNIELQADNRKLYEQDRKMLLTIQGILFNEIAYSLETTYEKVEKRVEKDVEGISAHR